MIIWYIDGEEDDRFTYKTQLEDAVQNKVTIKDVNPISNCNKMVDLIFSEKETVGVVIDQRLCDSGSVNYNGLDLARAIRKLNDKIPLYILTNHSNDPSSDEWEVEYVFSKSDFIDKKQLIGERIRRHINIFFDITQKRGKRFVELLTKSMDNFLSEDELIEFKKLDFYRTSIILKDEVEYSNRLKNELDEQEKLLKKIKDKLEGIK